MAGARERQLSAEPDIQVALRPSVGSQHEVALHERWLTGSQMMQLDCRKAGIRQRQHNAVYLTTDSTA